MTEKQNKTNFKEDLLLLYLPF